MARKLIVGIILLAAIVIAGTLAIYLSLTKSSAREAFITGISGEVEINNGKGWQAATEGFSLKANDKVRAGNGKAVIVLYESTLISLADHTEVMIKELGAKKAITRQENGVVWNKFTGLTGMESYEAETPYTVAAVRGTGWESTTTTDGGQIIVSDGRVEYAYGKLHATAGTMEKYVAKEGKLQKTVVSGEEKERLRKHIEQDIITLKKLRWDELRKNSILYSGIKAQGYDDSKIQSWFDDVDNGNANEEEVTKRIHFRLQTVDKILSLNKIIRQEMALKQTI